MSEDNAAKAEQRRKGKAESARAIRARRTPEHVAALNKKRRDVYASRSDEEAAAYSAVRSARRRNRTPGQVEAEASRLSDWYENRTPEQAEARRKSERDRYAGMSPEESVARNASDSARYASRTHEQNEDENARCRERYALWGADRVMAKKKNQRAWRAGRSPEKVAADKAAALARRLARALTSRGRALSLLQSASASSRKHGRHAPTITVEEVARRIEFGHSELRGVGPDSVGLPFDMGPNPGGGANHFAPSLHRVDNSKGYTPENCLIVCWFENRAIGSFNNNEPVLILGAQLKSVTHEERLSVLEGSQCLDSTVRWLESATDDDKRAIALWIAEDVE